MHNKQIVNLTALCLCLAATLPAQAPNAAVLATGLAALMKILLTSSGNLLVTETGTEPNGGRLTRVSRGGVVQPLLAGLPAATNEEGNSGPTGVAVNGRTVYVAIGEGDTLIGGTVPGTQVPNPKGPSSQLFSSIFALQFSTDADLVQASFTLTDANRQALADGEEVALDNGAGDKLTISVLTDFKDLVADPNTITRASNPFALALDGDTLYVADSGMNMVRRVDVRTGRARILARIAPIPNSQQPGPPVSDPVPTGLRVRGGQLLVSLLTGFPFAPEAARVLAVDTTTGVVSPFINFLSSALDVTHRVGASGCS